MLPVTNAMKIKDTTSLMVIAKRTAQSNTVKPALQMVALAQSA
jgi:hypothetical protein